MSGVIFEHKPDWAIGINRYDDGQGNDNIYIDFHDLVNNQSTYIGAVAVGTGANTPQGGDNSINLLAAFDNSNVLGVTSDSGNIGDPATATTGLEVAIPLSALGNPTGTIKILAVLTGGTWDQACGDGQVATYMSNQTLPALNVGDPSRQFPNAAWSRCPSAPFDMFPFDFSNEEFVPGQQYVSVEPCPAGGAVRLRADGFRLARGCERRRRGGRRRLADGAVQLRGRVLSVASVECGSALPHSEKPLRAVQENTQIILKT